MEKIKDNEIDLRLALGVTHQPVETFTDRDAGANANSRSRTDAILGHRPLPELVWSTQNGLTIKCGGCTSCVAGKTPCALSDEKCMFEESVKSAVGPTVENDGEVKFVHNKGKGKECMSIPVTGTGEGAITIYFSYFICFALLLILSKVLRVSRLSVSSVRIPYFCLTVT
ncbi:hypothetical protein HanHA300_Chr15g0552441 [Helianthus annuus]|nr:hypothetical protein HanHA300_Chr15g0552441 [Helianthus annuus]KAJ0647471.1 hypothetical protein HanLR1_Chr15g0562231 [Helianthus annuus]